MALTRTIYTRSTAQEKVNVNRLWGRNADAGSIAQMGIELMGYLEHMSSAKMLEKFEALLPWNLHVLDLTSEMVS